MRMMVSSYINPLRYSWWLRSVGGNMHVSGMHPEGSTIGFHADVENGIRPRRQKKKLPGYAVSF